MKTKDQEPTDLIRSWQLPYAARLGSSVRSKGIYLEARARLPTSARKARKAAWKAKLTRSKNAAAVETNANLVEDDDRFKLRGWAEFEREGPR